MSARLTQLARHGLQAAAATAQAPLKNLVVKVLAHEHPSGIDYDAPLGDAGMFGPSTTTWVIHADFPGMMAGGICALMLQTLHPAALSGVWDHSNFRKDLIGRLRRTTAFVAGTTYAPTADAERLIEQVRRIHDRVSGTAPDGRPYSANDPDLLTWVHCTEMWSFLRGYERYRPAQLPVAVKDRYYAETARIAERLGAREVPKSHAEVEAYFQRVRPTLHYSNRSEEVLDVLAGIRLPIPLAGVSRHLFLGAGAALLPGWAQAMIPRNAALKARDRAAAESLLRVGPLLRAALREGVAYRASRRVGVDYAVLTRRL